MAQFLKLDALVTMLTCLSSTQNELSSTMGAENMHINNNTDTCPMSTFDGLTARLQNLASDINEIKDKVDVLKEQLAEFTTASIVHPVFATRFYNPDADERENLPTAFVEAADAAVAGVPRNCLQQEHGLVRIQPAGEMEAFYVFCDQKIRGGGWTVIANRYDGSLDFNRSWSDYKSGFGALNTEFFIGLEKLHLITNSASYELLVVLEDRKQEQHYALYSQFSIGNEQEKYTLNVLGDYSGDSSDALRQHAGKKFSTRDQDNDGGDLNCAHEQSGGWWYTESCRLSNLFGLYQRLLERDVNDYKGILWTGLLDGPKGSLKSARILLRPKGN